MTATEPTVTGGVQITPAHVAVAVGASIAGTLVHNLAEFPPSILLAPGTVVPVAITVLLGIAILRRPEPAVFGAAIGWAVIVIVGGGASVLPLPIWPFTPEQTVGHYVAHVVYALAQLPLLWVGWRGFQTGRRSNDVDRGG